MQDLVTTHRSFRLKNGEYNLTRCLINEGTKSNISCTIHIMNNENNEFDDTEKQLYKFDTQGVRN